MLPTPSWQITINLSPADMLAVIDFHLAYGSDVAKARDLAVAAARRHRSVRSVDSCLLAALGEAGMILSLRLVCESPVSVYQTRLDLLDAVKRRFDENGISIAHAATTIDLRDARPM